MAKKNLRQFYTRLHNGWIMDCVKLLSENELKVYLVIAMYANWETGLSSPTSETIASQVGCSARTVVRVGVSLEKKGLLSRELRKAKDKEGNEFGKKRYFYILTYPAKQAYIRKHYTLVYRTQLCPVYNS